MHGSGYDFMTGNYTGVQRVEGRGELWDNTLTEFKENETATNGDRQAERRKRRGEM